MKLWFDVVVLDKTNGDGDGFFVDVIKIWRYKEQSLRCFLGYLRKDSMASVVTKGAY